MMLRVQHDVATTRRLVMEALESIDHIEWYEDQGSYVVANGHTMYWRYAIEIAAVDGDEGPCFLSMHAGRPTGSPTSFDMKSPADNEFDLFVRFHERFATDFVSALERRTDECTLLHPTTTLETDQVVDPILALGTDVSGEADESGSVPSGNGPRPGSADAEDAATSDDDPEAFGGVPDDAEKLVDETGRARIRTRDRLRLVVMVVFVALVMGYILVALGP